MRREGGTTGAYTEYLGYNWPTLLGEAAGQVAVVAVALVAAMAVALALGVYAYRRERLANVILSVASAALTLPSLALFGLMIPLFGIGALPTVVVLLIYALMPILRNIITGLQGVDPAILEAAAGVGMTAWRRLVVVEIPLAWPVILAGLRFSTMMIVGVAAVGAYVGGPGLGTTLFNGLEEIGSPAAVPEVVVATGAILVLALLMDALLAGLARLSVSRGIRD